MPCLLNLMLNMKVAGACSVNSCCIKTHCPNFYILHLKFYILHSNKNAVTINCNGVAVIQRRFY
jgi:hypothetical protein